MSDHVTVAEAIDAVRRWQRTIAEQRDDLTELDSVIGDADHGTNMARGLDAVIHKLDESTPATFADLGKLVGMALISTVGGTSGPLYGTLFLRFGTTGGAATEIDTAGFGAALRAGVDGIVARGKAEPGDKTMVDALIPAVDAWDQAAADGVDAAAAAALAAAQAGRDATIPLVARKGRASYLGERSAGHLDPGAASATMLISAIRDAVVTA